MRKVLIGIIVVLSAAVVVLGVKVVPILFNTENKIDGKCETIDEVIVGIEKAMKDPDLYEFNKLHMPEEVIDRLIEERLDGDKQGYKDNMDNGSDFWKERYEEENIEVLSVERAGNIREADEATEIEVKEDLGEDLSITIDEVKTCTIKIRFKEDGYRKSHEEECVFYRSGDYWHLKTDSEYLLGCFWDA